MKEIAYATTSRLPSSAIVGGLVGLLFPPSIIAGAVVGGAALASTSANLPPAIHSSGSHQTRAPCSLTPEAAAARGRLVFLTNSVLVPLCVPEGRGYAGEQLRRPPPDVRRVRWPEGGVEFHPAHGDWVRVLRADGFVVEALHELYAPQEAETHRYYEIVTAECARRWPVEDLWVAWLDTTR